LKMKAAHAQIQYVLQMTKLAIIPFTVLLETIFLKKRFRLVRKTISDVACLLDVLIVQTKTVINLGTGQYNILHYCTTRNSCRLFFALGWIDFFKKKLFWQK
jgi:hypothetical protein